MEANELKEEHRNDEIDLYNLWVILKKRKITVFVIMLICLGAAITYAILTPKIYRVSNTLMLDQPEEIISKGEVIATINGLDGDLALHGDKVPRLSEQVKGLDGIKKIIASDIKATGGIRVEIETLDKRAGVALMEALPNYILSDSNIALKLQTRKTLAGKNIADLKRIIDNPVRDIRMSSRAVVFVSSADLYSLREKYNYLTMVKEKLEEGKVLTLALRTQPPDRQYKPKRQRVVLAGLVVGCFLGMLVAFIVEWASSNRYARGLN